VGAGGVTVEADFTGGICSVSRQPTAFCARSAAEEYVLPRKFTCLVRGYLMLYY
jgi:hypothetical protein